MPKRGGELKAVQIIFLSFYSMRNFIWRKRLRNRVLDGRQRLQISEDCLQIVICHIAIPNPRHWRKNWPSGTLMLAGAKGIDEHLLCPASQSCFFVRCEIHREADAPWSRPSAEMVVRYG